MRYGIAITLLFVVASAGQPSPAKQPHNFKWDGRRSQSPNIRLSEAKNISPQDRVALMNVLSAQYKGDSSAKTEAAGTRVSFVDLNGDHVPEVIAQASGDICSPTGNCPFWAFRKTGTEYALILSKGAVQGFTIQPTRTEGYSDLVLEMHGSATMQELFLYQFHNDRYRRTACYDANWTYADANDEIHELEDPRITPCSNQ